MVRKLLSAAAAALMLASLEAHATTLAFSFDTATFSVSGDVAVSDTLDSVGGFDVTGISGAVSGPNGGAITSLIANPTQPVAHDNGSWVYDNVVFSSGPWVDGSGLLFAAGGYDYNLYSAGSTDYLSSLNPTANFDPGEVVDRLTVTAIPEPAIWLMMGLGFAAFGAARRRASREDRRAALA